MLDYLAITCPDLLEFASGTVDNYDSAPPAYRSNPDESINRANMEIAIDMQRRADKHRAVVELSKLPRTSSGTVILDSTPPDPTALRRHDAVFW